MPDKPSPDDRDLASLEREIIYVLTDPEGYPTIWSVADLGRELDYWDPKALVAPLRQAGLLYQITDQFVVATPAAFKLVGLTGHVV